MADDIYTVSTLKNDKTTRVVPLEKAKQIISRVNDTDVDDTSVYKLVQDALKASSGDRDAALKYIFDRYLNQLEKEEKKEVNNRTPDEKNIAKDAMALLMLANDIEASSDNEIQFNYTKAIENAENMRFSPLDKAIREMVHEDFKYYVIPIAYDWAEKRVHKIIKKYAVDENVGMDAIIAAIQKGEGSGSEEAKCAIKALQRAEKYKEEEAAKEAKKTADLATAKKTAEAMTITKWLGSGGEGEATPVDIAKAEIFGDRNKEGEVINLDFLQYSVINNSIDVTSQLTELQKREVSSWNKYGYDRGRMLFDHDKEGIDNLRKRITDILSAEDIKIAFSQAGTPEQRLAVYQRLHAKWGDNAHNYALYILNRAEEIQARMYESETEIPSFTSGKQQFEPYQNSVRSRIEKMISSGQYLPAVSVKDATAVSSEPAEDVSVLDGVSAIHKRDAGTFKDTPETEKQQMRKIQAFLRDQGYTCNEFDTSGNLVKAFGDKRDGVDGIGGDATFAQYKNYCIKVLNKTPEEIQDGVFDIAILQPKMTEWASSQNNKKEDVTKTNNTTPPPPVDENSKNEIAAVAQNAKGWHPPMALSHEMTQRYAFMNSPSLAAFGMSAPITPSQKDIVGAQGKPKGTSKT